MTTAKKIAEDSEFGPIRAAVYDEYIAAGKPKPEMHWLYSRLVEARARNAELEQLFDLQWSRTVEATKLWQKAHDKPLTMPDLGKLIEWLLARRDEAIEACARECERVTPMGDECAARCRLLKGQQ